MYVGEVAVHDRRAQTLRSAGRRGAREASLAGVVVTASGIRETCLRLESIDIIEKRATEFQTPVAAPGRLGEASPDVIGRGERGTLRGTCAL